MNGERGRPHPSPAGGTLAGADVVLLRTPDRAGPMAEELRARGARTRLLPLIDFQLPADTAAVSAGLRELGSGSFDWMIFTSATTVQALAAFAREAGAGLPELLAGTRVAAVGAGTRRALADRGITADLVPQADQSARGLAAAWPAAEPGRNRIFLPQADIADPFLRNALGSGGWDVQAVAAYRTVDYPAAAELRLEPVPAGDTPEALEPKALAEPEPEPLSPAQYRRLAAASRPHVVVVTSPSTARRFVRDCLVPGAALLTAIGDPTAQQLRELGQAPASTAASPTPGGIADAVEAALAAHQISSSTDPEGRTHL